MPFRIVQSHDGKGYMVQNIHTKHLYSSFPLSLDKAKAQMRILNNVASHEHSHHHSKDEHKFAQDVIEHMKKGTLTREATKHHEKPLEFAETVLKHPSEYSLRMRRKAQFLKNIQPKH